MKGFVFTEFCDMVDQTFSPVVLETIITKSNLPSKGIYTSAGYYAHQEMVTLVTELSRETNTSIPDLLKAFGRYLFPRFKTLYPAFIERSKTAFDMLASVDNYIHVEVLKLYPDAELPRIYTTPLPNGLEMIYKSSRHLEDLAQGLIEGCIEHFGENIQIKRESVQDETGDFTRFILTKHE
jgi:hypothetical protein